MYNGPGAEGPHGHLWDEVRRLRFMLSRPDDFMGVSILFPPQTEALRDPQPPQAYGGGGAA